MSDPQLPQFGCQGGSDNPDLDFALLSDYILNDDLQFDLFEDVDLGPATTTNNNSNNSNGTASAMVPTEQQLLPLESTVVAATTNNNNNNNNKRKLAAPEANREQHLSQQDRRRERNKVLARETRQRKKFFFESLQKRVTDLTEENAKLKRLVQDRLPRELSAQVLADCQSLPSPPILANQTRKATAILEQSDFRLIRAIQAAQRAFVITDPALPDNPIIFASQGFLDLCGYKLWDVLGRNCRFLQGPLTDQKQIQLIREGIAAGRDTSVCLLNYRADGSTFYNQFFVAALRDVNHRIINYVGVQVEVKGPTPA